MRRAIVAAYVLSSTFLSPVIMHAQAKPAEAASTHYKLVFRLLQLDAGGKVSNSRTYTSIISARGDRGSAAAQIRSGDRVPFQSEPGKFDYADVGTNIDAYQAIPRDNQLSMHVSAEISSAVKSTNDPQHLLPLVRRTSWGADISVPVDKPTIVFSSDNPSDTGKTELELTATEIK